MTYNSGLGKGIVLALVISASFFVIFAHIALGYFTFPQVDDYEMATQVQQNHKSLLGLISHMYFSLCGRFAIFTVEWVANSLISLYELKFFIISSIILFVGALLVSFRSIYHRFNDAFIVDIAFMFWMLSHFVKREGFYWMLGNMDYMFPTSLLLLTLAALYHLKRLRYEYAFHAFLFLFFAFMGGFSEQLSIAILGYLSIYVAFTVIKRPQFPPHISRRLAISLLGLCVGFAIDLAAPGNYIRHAIYTGGKPQDIAALFGASLYDLADIYLPLFILSVYYGLVRAYFFAIPSLPGRISGRKMLIYALSAIAICWSMTFIIRYGYNTSERLHGFFIVPYIYDANDMGGRASFCPQVFVIFCGIIFSNWLFETYSAARIKQRKILPLIVLGTFTFIMHFYWPVMAYRTHMIFQSLSLASAQQASAYHQMRVAQQAKDRGDQGLVTLPAIKDYDIVFSVYDITPDATRWENILVANYFGLNQVVRAHSKGTHP